MPFKSKSQEKWMWANYPKMARQWEKHTQKTYSLPVKVSSSKEKEK